MEGWGSESRTQSEARQVAASHALDAWLEDPRALLWAQWHAKNHDRACLSLPGLWLPLKGGYSDNGELWRCDRCGLLFHLDWLKLVEDGVQAYIDEGDTDWYDAFYCHCCWRAMDKDEELRVEMESDERGREAGRPGRRSRLGRLFGGWRRQPAR